jgi:hypothetical protein
MRYKCLAFIAILVWLSFGLESEHCSCEASDGYGTPWQDYTPGLTGQRTQESFNGGFDNTHKPMVRSAPQMQFPPQQLPGQTQQQQRQVLQQQRPQAYFNGPRERTPEKNTMQSLEEALDKADNSASWSKVPVSRSAPVRGATPTLINGVNSSYPYTPARQYAAIPGAGAGPGNPLAGMFPKMTRQDLMRMFLEGGTPQMGGGFGGASPGGSAGGPSSADLAGKSSTAYSNYQRAENEDAKARDYAERARYADSRYSAQEYASSAEYAANNAEYAADRAESAAYSGDSQAKGYASSARNAANRARENANRARYNAEQKQ